MCFAPFPTAGSLADPYSSGHMLNTNGSHKKIGMIFGSNGVWWWKYATKKRLRLCEISQVYSADSTCSCGNKGTHPIQLAVGEILYFRTEKHQIPTAVIGVSLSEPHIDM